MVQAQSLVPGYELKAILAKMTLQEAACCHDFETLGVRYRQSLEVTDAAAGLARRSIKSSHPKNELRVDVADHRPVSIARADR
jgi:hypothetical protein